MWGTFYRGAPERIGEGVHFVEVSGGRRHACALTAYCWGDNLGGTLGSGEPDWYCSREPVPVDTVVRFSSIEPVGQLGTGDFIDRSIPTRAQGSR